MGIGGDSLIQVHIYGKERVVKVGPLRQGPAVAFGGDAPTLVDAHNVLALAGEAKDIVGDGQASQDSMTQLAHLHGMDVVHLSHQALAYACEQVRQGVTELLMRVNGQPVYTLAELLEEQVIEPQCAWLVGGPAEIMLPWLEKALGLPVHVPEGAATANAVGAALTLPTAQIEFFADTMQGLWRVPVLEKEGRLDKQFYLHQVQEIAVRLLREQEQGVGFSQETEQACHINVTEATLFATLDERGHGGKDIRVRCQVQPGIVKMVN